jgi:hypothetical protein
MVEKLEPLLNVKGRSDLGKDEKPTSLRDLTRFLVAWSTRVKGSISKKR